MMLAQLALPLLLLGAAGEGNDIVLILDNSCSMATAWPDTQTGKMVPANDPERAAVLGTLLVEGLTRNSEDRFTVLAFGDSENAAPREARTAAEIRGLPYSKGTFFRQPLLQAGQRLRSSPLPQRLLLFFTDGIPQDLKTPEEGPEALGLMEASEMSRLVIGLFGSEEVREMGEQFLRPLVVEDQEMVSVKTSSEVVDAFTRGYARVLGSRPETGTLSPGETKTFEVSKYVVEVLVSTASSEPGPAYTAKLEGPNGDIAAQATGDNGCGPGMPRFANAQAVCKPPFRHYQVFRAAHPPEKSARWTLSLPEGQGPIDYGIILRYDLKATLAVPPTARAGEPVKLDARLLFRGKTFDDEAFFQADGFTAVATVGREEIPLKHAGGGQFVAEWTAREANVGGPPVPVQVTFRNAWMEQSARRSTQVEGYLDLKLTAAPSPVELGEWRGERGASRRCVLVDLSRSRNADRIPLACTPQGAVEGGAVSCTPVEGSEASLENGRKGQPLRYEVCFTARGCCGELSPQGLGVTFAGADPHYAATTLTVPVNARVHATGWLRCYGPWLAALAGLLFLLWLILGFIRPNDFDPAACVYVAGSEAGLRRASALVLREMPGGTRGFYRDARMCLNASGDFLRKPRAAALVLEAGPGGSTRFVSAPGLERKVQRTGQWEPVPAEELALGYTPNTVYRIGSLFLRWG